MKRVSHHRQLLYWPVQLAHAEHAGRTQHRQSVTRVIPKLSILGQCLIWLKERSHVAGRIFLP
ncbi:MAG TPA: hypothetical protein VN673_01665 [Clostridia bacterium]|nr:hypothetical protein [Clostridia bacterium]